MQTHSIFFQSLTKHGHQLTYMSASDNKLVIQKFGEYLYDNIVYFAPETENFEKITYDDFSTFMDNGGNLVVAATSSASNGLRDFAETCGVEFDPSGSEVIDHFNYSKDMDTSLQHTAVITDNVLESNVILKDFSALSKEKKNVVYRGLGHAIDESNVLAVKTLRGSDSAYSATPQSAIRTYPENAGADTLLVSSIQARNNARIVFSGSLDMFSNEYFAVEDSGNKEFCEDLSAWAFGDRGVLRFRDVTHHKSDGTPPDVILHEKDRPNDLPVSLFPDPEIARNSLVYRIKDELVYSLVVEEWSGDDWKPFYAEDMQLEFVMLDPHVRTTMVGNRDTGKFISTFTAPDNYGIFKFRMLYRRIGYSVLHSENTVSLRPYKHDEYDRFLFTAYPYYTSAFSAMSAFFVFSLFFMFSEEEKGEDKKEK